MGLQLRPQLGPMCLNSIASLARTVTESCEMRSLLARAFRLVVQVLVDHRLAICSLIVVLKFWRDHVDARRKSFQVRVNLLLQELSSILILPTLPWLLLVVTCCSLSLSVVSLGASVDPSTPQDLFLPSQRLGQSMCALVLRGVCKSWTSGHLPSTLGFMTSAQIASPCFTRPRFELGLLHSSQPNELDCHASSSRGSLRSSITMYSTLACPRHTYRRHPLHKLSSCLMSSTTRSRVDSSRFVDLNKVSLSGSRLTVEWSHVPNLLPWHSMVTSNITSSVDQSATRSSHSNVRESGCRSPRMQALLCAAVRQHMASTIESDHHGKNITQTVLARFSDVDRSAHPV